MWGWGVLAPHLLMRTGSLYWGLVLSQLYWLPQNAQNVLFSPQSSSVTICSTIYLQHHPFDEEEAGKGTAAFSALQIHSQMGGRSCRQISLESDIKDV